MKIVTAKGSQSFISARVRQRTVRNWPEIVISNVRSVLKVALSGFSGKCQ